jgi:hypothetical protein
VTTFVLRVWLPDRPGALGAVASRIGAVRGDLVGIDILERGGGRVIDELVVELPNEGLLPLLVQEVSQVDGVDVEDARPGSDKPVDPRLDALELAASLVDQTDTSALLQDLTAHLAHALEAEWVAAVQDNTVLASVGDAPTGEWLRAFVAGSQSSESVAEGHHGPEDVACAPLAGADLALVLGRQGTPFRARERRQLAALARIAGRRLKELS